MELLLVVLIIAALAAIVGASLSGSGSRARVEATGRALVAIGRAARARASAEGRTYFLIVDGENKEVRLARQRDPLAAPDAGDEPELEASAEWQTAWNKSVPFEEGVGLASSLVAGVAPETGTVPRVAFGPDGSAEEASFDLDDGTGSNLRVVIEPANARTRILTSEERDEAVAAGTALPPSGGASASDAGTSAGTDAAKKAASSGTKASSSSSTGSSGSTQLGGGQMGGGQ
jgi:type II secretory pathway pseudopilin PulG